MYTHSKSNPLASMEASPPALPAPQEPAKPSQPEARPGRLRQPDGQPEP
ncbi:hypothetical protein N9L68_08105 [bacterium]|nr:hypothetical protein [bacterium]